MSFTDLPPGAKVIQQQGGKPQFTDLPPGATVVGGNSAPKANPLTADPAMKGVQGIADYIARLIQGTMSIPERSGPAIANAANNKLTPEMMGPVVDAALLGATGRSPFAGAGADTARLAGAGTRNAEAGAAGEAAVADAVRPQGPWDPGGTAQAQGQRAVTQALTEAPRPVAPGGTQPPPMPASVAAAVDKAVPAPKPFEPPPRVDEVGPPRPSEITAADRAEADALLGREAAARDASGRGPSVEATAKVAGESAVERAMKAPGWIKTPEWVRASPQASSDFVLIMEELTTRAQRRAAPLRGAGGELLTPEQAVAEALRKAGKAPGWLRRSPEPTPVVEPAPVPDAPPPVASKIEVESAGPQPTSIPSVAQPPTPNVPPPITWESHNINIATALTALLHGHPLAAAATLAIKAWARAHPTDAASIVGRVASPKNIQKLLSVLGLAKGGASGASVARSVGRAVLDIPKDPNARAWLRKTAGVLRGEHSLKPLLRDNPGPMAKQAAEWVRRHYPEVDKQDPKRLQEIAKEMLEQL